MSDELEASQGPSADSPVSGEVVEALTNDEPTLDDELSQAWDKANGEEPDEAPDEPEVEEVEQAENPEEPAAEEVELPTDLPASLKEHWANIPEAARAAISATQKELSDKFSAANREVSAFKPIRGALEQAIQSNPAIANMKPEQVAAQIPQLIGIGQQLKADPVNTLLAVAQNNGVLDKLAQALTGQDAQNGNEAALLQKISQLEGQVKQLNDPSRLKQTFDSFYRESSVEQEVAKFAGETENWSEIEAVLPKTIPLAQEKLGENASPRSVLEEATQLAVQIFMPDKAQKPAPVPEAEAAIDPAQVQKAKDAKSVNVKAKSAGRSKPASLDDELGAIYDKAAS